MCKSCDNEIYDGSTGISECKCWEQMTEEEYDKYFGDEHAGCPFYKEHQKDYADLYAEGVALC